MRHLKRNAKLGRKGEHRNAMLANLVCSLIKAWKAGKCVTTTLAKAKAARPVAEKLVTLGKKGTLHHRRLAAARLKQQARTHFRGTPTKPGKELREAWRENEDVVRILFDEIAPEFSARPGGYTRIVKLHRRRGDAAEMAMLEWVDEEFAGQTPAASKPKKEKKPKADEPKADEGEAPAEEEAAVEETADKAEDAPAAEVADEPKAEATEESDAEGEKPAAEAK